MIIMRAKTVIINLIVIALVYSACFWTGQQLKVDVRDSDIKFYAVIELAAETYDVHPALVTAVIHAESNFNPRARSYAGAKGLMQINPPTQQHLRLRNAYDPKQNIDAGTRYLRELLNRFDGNVIMALAAYNAGPGAVRKYAGVPPYRETRNYVKKVMGFFKTYRDAFQTNPLIS
jgi:soluble lytic murein transglycosylase-like protein